MRILPLLLVIFFCYHCLGASYKINQPSEHSPVKIQTVAEYTRAKAEFESKNTNLLKEYRKSMFQRVCGSDILHELMEQKKQEKKHFLNSLFPLNWLKDQFTSEVTQNTCPTKTQCDEPNIRDLYSSVSSTTYLNIEFVIERGTSLANNADSLIPILLTELNNGYASTNIQFIAEKVLWGPLLSNSGTPVGTWYTNFNGYCDSSAYQPCYSHISIANDIFSSRGSYKKNNTVVLFVSNIQGGQILGFAYFPWIPNNGLVVVIPNTLTPGDTTIRHEIGHSLGLWHTHRGSSEVYKNGQCPLNSGCYEEVASDTTGDFCDDTGPFPNPLGAGVTTCRAPTVSEVPDPCNPSRTAWSTLNTVNNYMSYTLDSCQNTFTTKQARRMRCYIERIGYPATASTLLASVFVFVALVFATIL